MYAHLISVFKQTVRYHRMDYKARESVWRKKATNIFTPNTSVSNVDSSVSDQEIFRKYKNAMFKKTRFWWTRTALQNYVDHEIIPRGLRVQLFPTFDLKDEKLVKRWSQAATICSLEFLRIIIESNAQVISEIESELERLEELMKKDITKENLEIWSNEFNKDLDKWENDICQRKLKKYQRDMRDYEENKIYKWQWKKVNTDFDIHRKSSFNSISSASDASTSSTNHGPHMTTRSGGRKNEYKKQADIFTKGFKHRDDKFKL
ncbi:uncharacterized protein [Ranitomeya imitator]|uniref:uncharacterized protein n=1 Tax=Ranitomeya imitator TaxID=111125 RepID=UPI0037E756C0